MIQVSVTFFRKGGQPLKYNVQAKDEIALLMRLFCLMDDSKNLGEVYRWEVEYE